MWQKWCYLSSCLGIGGQLRLFVNHGELRNMVGTVCVFHSVAVFTYLIFNATLLTMAITDMLYSNWTFQKNLESTYNINRWGPQQMLYQSFLRACYLLIAFSPCFHFFASYWLLANIELMISVFIICSKLSFSFLCEGPISVIPK